jgi:hypothetical protein
MRLRRSGVTFLYRKCLGRLLVGVGVVVMCCRHVLSHVSVDMLMCIGVEYKPFLVMHCMISHKNGDVEYVAAWLGMSRKPVSVTLPKACLDWIDRKVESRVYANRSHALEVIILEAMKGEGGQ